MASPMVSTIALLFLAIAAHGAVAQRPTKEEWKAGQASAKEADAAVAAKSSKMAAVNKVIDMLESLQAQILKEGEEEVASYNKFACFCKDTTADKTEAIQKGEDEKEALITDINSLDVKRNGLDKQIKMHQDTIADTEKEIKEAEEERAATLKQYKANDADLKAALVALEGAIKTLKASKTPSLLQFQKISDTLQTAMMLADALGVGNEGSRKAVAMFLQQPANGNEVPMEDYKFHSDNIIATLEGLLKDFKDEKASVDAEEVSSVQAHNMLIEEKKNLIKQTNKKMEDAKKTKEETIENIESNNKRLTTVESNLLEDKNYMMKLSEMCSNTAKTWDQRSKARAAELSTLTEATGIIKDTVAEKTSAATVRLVQKGMSVRVVEVMARDQDLMNNLEAEAEAADDGAPALVQISQHAAPKSGAEFISELLAKDGKQLKSTLLTSLASKIHGSDPFAKIKTLIQELIERLLQEAANEANQKGWCDKAMSDARQKREYAAEEIKVLNSEMAKLEAVRDKLTEDLAELAEGIQKLNTSRAEAVAERETEKAENNATVVEAQEGLDALDMCITLLDRFYKTSNKEKVDLSLAQADPMEDAPGAGFKIGEAYKGAQAESGGILGMLDVMKSDFTRTIVETEKAEAQAEQDHLEFMTETGKSLAEKTMAEEQKTSQKSDAEDKLDTADEDLSSQTAILKTSLNELLELKPACIDTGMSYEERVARREDEIAALKKAMCILEAFAEYGPEGAAGAC